MTFEGDASMPVRGTLHVLSLCSRDIAKESSVDSSWSAAAHLGCGGFILVRGKGEPDDSSTMLEAPFHTRWPRRTGEVGIKGAGSTRKAGDSGVREDLRAAHGIVQVNSQYVLGFPFRTFPYRSDTLSLSCTSHP